MKNKSKLLALELAVSVGMTSIAVQAFDVKATEDLEQISQQDIDEEENGETDGVVEVTDIPAEDGEYVVYMENDITEEVSFSDKVLEISTDSPAIILETDLSASQIGQLEELSEQQEEVYVEENFFLTGASNVEGTNGIERDEEGADFAERLALKNALMGQFADKNGETEWNIQIIHADNVDVEEAGTPVKVAVLDSGVEFLAGIPIDKSINFVKDEQDLPYYMNDMTGHGTAVTDIIHQVCPQAQIYSVKVMDSENRGRLSDVVAGIYWCMEQDVDIINMSFGTSVESAILRKAIQEAAERGIMLVSSAGNGGTGSPVEYPAAFEEVIAVGAVDTSARKTEESATGVEIEIVAPGEQILTKSMLGLETVNSGTSMAAPHVAGAAALLMQQSESKNAEFIRKVLDRSSNPLGDESAYGYGLVDVAYAQEILSEYEEIMMDERMCEENRDSENGTAADCGIMDVNTETACHGSADGEDEITPGEATQKMQGEPDTKKEQDLDVIDELEQLSRPVKHFEEVDYVEGRWATKAHRDMAVEVCEELGAFSEVETKIFKKGAGFPDDDDSGMKGGSKCPEWHGWNGWKGENYIANYIFATRIAKAAGDTRNLKKVKGQNETSYNRMKMSISILGINGQEWNNILGKWNYSGQNEKTQKRWRQIFIYGMAFHTATDSFAHNSYYKDTATGKMIHIVSLGGGKDDDPKTIENRWKCARNTGFWVVADCYLENEGSVTDFSSWGETYWSGFYMGNILRYAVEANGGKDEESLKTEFKSVNYDLP